MVNRFVLNAVSYHGNGAIKEIPAKVSKKHLLRLTPILLNSELPRR